MSGDESFEKLSALGERKAVELVTSLLSPGDPEMISVGPGDDCAAIKLGDDYLVVTTDMTTQKTHYPPNITPYQIGWHVVAINLSDLAAKGAKPIGLLIAAGLPKDYNTKFLEDLIFGMNSCATHYGTTIVGGDLKSHDELTITGTAIGKVAQSAFMPRNGAQPGDFVGITGTLGHAGAGYYTLKHNLDKENKTNLIGLFEPKPKLEAGYAMGQSGVVNCCMDISDGLADSLYQLAKINNVGFDIIFDDIPIDPKASELSSQLNIPIEDLTIYFGGDYELLVTVKSDSWDWAEAAVAGAGSKLTQIGLVTPKNELNLIQEGQQIALENRGFEHFKWTG